MVVNGRISTVTRLPVQVDSMIGFLGSNHPLVFPVDVKLAALAKGAFAVCASSTKGVQCWGGNIEGTLGIGKASEQCKTPGSGNFDCNSKPVRVTGKWRSSRKPGSVSLMRTTVCALARSGKARCWGKGSTGMLGNGTTTMIQPTPVRVSGGKSLSRNRRFGRGSVRDQQKWKVRLLLGGYRGEQDSAQPIYASVKGYA